VTRYTTQEAAKAIRVSYQTLLRWLYAKQLPEPQRMMYGGQNLRLWTKADIARARKYKIEGLADRRSKAAKAAVEARKARAKARKRVG
jgi:hypothetical protein